MFDLDDLSRVVAVSRPWSAAVRSMAPIAGEIDRDGDLFHSLPPIASIVGSPLLRHLATLQIRKADLSLTPLNNVSLRLLARHAPNLTSLGCLLKHRPNALILPAKLQSLELQLRGNPPDAAVNCVLTSVAALPSLSRLTSHSPLSNMSQPLISASFELAHR